MNASSSSRARNKINYQSVPMTSKPKRNARLGDWARILLMPTKVAKAYIKKPRSSALESQKGKSSSHRLKPGARKSRLKPG
jgi:hypothetical protein